MFKNISQFLFAKIVFIGLLCFALSSHADELPAECGIDCASTFGQVLGTSPKGIKAYSNCNNECVFRSPYFVDETFTGIRWQCVEYARRWLLENKGVVYGDVDIAADIWSLQKVKNPSSEKEYSFVSFENGKTDSPPAVGDLLIYARALWGTGHVAVVLRVDTQSQQLYVGEQNFDNRPWDGDHARVIPYVSHNGTIWLLDSYLIGWKRVDEPQNSISMGANLHPRRGYRG